MNRFKNNWNCCENNNNWGCGKVNSNHWGGCEKKNKCEEKKQDKFCCFCYECENKQEEKRPYCSCQGKEQEKGNYGCGFDCGFNYSGYGYDYNQQNFGYNDFYSQGY